jgi:tripartite-type tricarboxylate transporter receptor subunit TctC
VPTSKEAGFPNFQMSIWYGMFAPAGTPREVISRLHREVAKALDDPALRQHMSNAGMDPWLGTPEDMGSLVRNETNRYAKIIQSAGIRKDAM